MPCSGQGAGDAPPLAEPADEHDEPDDERLTIPAC